MTLTWPRALIAILALLVGSCAFETYKEREPGIPLMLDLDALVSYSTEQAVRAALAPRPVTDVERSENPDKEQPPYTIARLGVASFEHLGFTGELNLVFFNDRLEAVWFFPDDFNAYTSTLKSRGVTITDDIADSRRALSHVWTDKTLEGKPYVAWGDSRLLEQARRWLLRHAW